MALVFREHSTNQLYSDYLQPLNQDVFKIFESRLKKLDLSLTKGRILDFGCNVGNLLKTANGLIHPSQYVGIDINQKALDLAAQEFPGHRFAYYNQFNNTFNPHGERDLRLPLSGKFDFIIAYGVFTHFFMDDIVKTVNELSQFLTTDGLLLFSLWEDVDYYGYLGFLDRQLGINVRIPKPEVYQNGFVLVDREKLLVDVSDSSGETFRWIESFYSPSYVLSTLKGSKRLEGIVSHHPVYCFTNGGSVA